MGIQRFYNTIKRNFNITTNINKYNSNDHYLFIDFNSIIHNIHIPQQYKINIYDYVIKELNLKIIDLIKPFVNIKYIYIAIDGVPSFAKMIEQMKRRYLGDLQSYLLKNYKLTNEFSKANISPETPFMFMVHHLLDKISNIIRTKKTDDSAFSFYTELNCEFIISNSSMKGEGEKKIIDEINKLNDNKKILYYSPDADSIIMSMISQNAKLINIIRYDQQTKNTDIVSIGDFIDVLYDYCFKRIGPKYNKQNIINDICLLFTVFGDDFVPLCEPLDASDIFFLIDTYLLALIDNGFLINNKINTQCLYNIFYMLSYHENRLLYRNTMKIFYKNYSFASKNNFIIDLNKIKNNESIDINKFYTNALLYTDISQLEINDKKYGNLKFYSFSKEQIVNEIKKVINKQVYFIDNFEYNNNYQKLLLKSTNSKDYKISYNNERDIEAFKIENKLDKYSSYFKPSAFYKSIFNTKTIIRQKIHSDDIDAVKEYLKGINWIYNYYFKNITDEKWFYKYEKTPLITTIVKYFDNKSLLLNIKNINLNISSIEQLLYISPYRKTNSHYLEIYNKKYHKYILEFVKDKDVEEFYNNILNNGLECDSFINKCHIHININDIDTFVQKWRKIEKKI